MAASSSPYVREVTDETFEAEVLDVSDSTPVIVDFWSPSCRPCLMLAPLLERLVNERQGKVILAKVNVDDAPQLAGYFRISAIPAVKAFYRRALVHQFEGLLPESALRQFLDEIAPEEDPALVQAQAAELAAPARAEGQYRTMIAAEPDHLAARLGLARVLLAQDKLDEIAEVLEPVGSSGEQGAEAESLLAQAKLRRAAVGLDEAALRQRVGADAKDAAARLELGTLLGSRGEYEAALPMLLAAAELDFKLASGKAREAMVAVFQGLGSSHPLANEYRAKLARLLY